MTKNRILSPHSNPILKACSFRSLLMTEVSILWADKCQNMGINSLFLHIVAASAISWHLLWISFFASLFQSSVKYWAKSVLARLSVSRTLWRRVNLSKYIAISCLTLNAFLIYGTPGFVQNDQRKSPWFSALIKPKTSKLVPKIWTPDLAYARRALEPFSYLLSAVSQCGYVFASLCKLVVWSSRYPGFVGIWKLYLKLWQKFIKNCALSLWQGQRNLPI